MFSISKKCVKHNTSKVNIFLRIFDKTIDKPCGIGALISLAFGDSVSFFGSGCSAVSNIVADVLLAKYFTDSGK